MKKLLAGGALAVLAFGGMVATATPASAHNKNVSYDCGFVNVNLEWYDGAKVTVVIDGETVTDEEFSPGFDRRYELSLDEAHEFTVSVDAYDDDQYDFTESGQIGVCQTPPPAEFVSPVIPEAVSGCAASLDDVVLPSNTDAIAYTKTEAGIVAALTSDAYAFPEDLGAYQPQPDGTALLPVDAIVFEEECEPAPSPTPTPSEPSVAPTDEASVPPAPAEPSASPSPAAEEPPVLAATGATVGGAVAFAALLAVGGVALVWARKRMQQGA